MTEPIELPRKRGIKTDRPRMIVPGGDPIAGQQILRLGIRHAIDFTPPLMRAEPDGRIWAAKLRLAKIHGALMHFRQDGLRIGSPGGTIAVDGADQAGMTLAMRGFTPGYALRFGQALSIIMGGRRHLHFCADERATIADADGRLVAAIFPALRDFPEDGDICEVARPMIQGSISGNEVAWDRLTAPYANFGTLTITEDR